MSVANIQICHACEDGPRAKGRVPCNGPCPCLADEQGRDIGDLAAARACPLGKFPVDVLHGLAGVARAVTGTGGAWAELVSQRTAICQDCPQATLERGVFRKCKLCGCATWAKVRNRAEKCPLGKW